VEPCFQAALPPHRDEDGRDEARPSMEGRPPCRPLSEPVPPDRLRALFEDLARVDRARYGRAWTPQPPFAGAACRRHLYGCFVSAAGTVHPCAGVPTAVGDVRQKRFADIVRDSEILQDLRNAAAMLKGPCADCAQAAGCAGCRGIAARRTGDTLASDPSCWLNAGRSAQILSLPLDAGAVIPQAPPMRVMDTLEQIGDRTAVAVLTVRPDNPFVGPDGALDEAAYLEIMAQAMAAMNGFRTYRASKGRPEGLLLGARNVEILGGARVGDVLRVDVQKCVGYGDLGVIEGRVSRGDTLLAAGEVKVWHNSGGAPAPTPK
jgi:radical SAM protein with 4Fe4S-binding SPASM domain